MRNFKTFFIEKVLVECGVETSPISLLDLGCGTAIYMQPLLMKYKNISYVGLEPFSPSFKAAQENLKDCKNATLHNQLGYGEIDGVGRESFDLVISMSALEHVKDWRSFLAMSVTYAKKGGHIIHRYDLGHALSPSSLKERFQVFLGNTFPSILPEHKFVRYVDREEVVNHMKELTDNDPYCFTNHQMPNHKTLEKVAKGTDLEAACQDLYEWEFAHRKEIEALPTKIREELFPAPAVWVRK